jgi:hypothetical protein
MPTFSQYSNYAVSYSKNYNTHLNIPTSIIIALQAYYSPLHAPLSGPLRVGSDSLQLQLSTSLCRLAMANCRVDDHDCRPSMYTFLLFRTFNSTPSNRVFTNLLPERNVLLYPIRFEYSNVPTMTPLSIPVVNSNP